MRKIKEKTIIVTMLLLFIGGYGLTNAMGLWHTETTKTPAKILSGDFAGENNPEDIRGSYTLNDIATQFEIPVDTLKLAFQLPEATDVEAFKSKDIETLYEGVEMGNDAMKAFIALYKGMPYELEGLILPDQAVDIILKQQPEMAADIVEALQATRLSLATVSEPIEETEGAVTAENTIENKEEDEPMINGNTTFAQALELGIQESEIVKVIGADIPNGAMTIKAYCLENSINFSEVKAELTAFVQE